MHLILSSYHSLRWNSSPTEWAAYEQVLVASLDMGDVDTAKKCLHMLVAQFPQSNRVNRARGMIFEYNGKYDEAMEVYTKSLEISPTNVLILKRIVCVHKAKGDWKAAINALNKVLEINVSDSASWIELSEIYITIGEFEAAAFCLEELVLNQPNKAEYHTRLGEIYYTMASSENYMRARSHFSMSLNLRNPEAGNYRAIYGLMLCCRALKRTIKDEKDHEFAVTTELLAWSKEKLQAIADDKKASSAVSILNTAINVIK